jgi:hypothetical protein
MARNIYSNKWEKKGIQNGRWSFGYVSFIFWREDEKEVYKVTEISRHFGHRKSPKFVWNIKLNYWQWPILARNQYFNQRVHTLYLGFQTEKSHARPTADWK